MKKNYTEHELFLKRLKKDKTEIICGRILLLVLIIFVWEIITALNIVDPFIYSSPSRIVKMFYNLLIEGNLIKHSLVTLYETIVAFTISMLIGLIIAIILFSFNKTRKIIEPYLIVINALPKIALGPLIIIWVGAGTKAIVLMGFLICIVITIISLLNSFLSVSQNKILLLKTMGASKFQILTHLILPESIPEIISVLKINVGMSWVGTIMGEYLVSKQGLGYLIVYGGYMFNLDLIMTAVIVLCTLAGLMYGLVASLEKFVCKNKK